MNGNDDAPKSFQGQTLEKKRLDVRIRSLAAFFYHAVGRLDEQLDKERQEAYAAQVKYDAAAQELTALDRLTAMRKAISADLDSEGERMDRITLDTPI